MLANERCSRRCGAAVPAGACITDVGSTKRSIVRAAERLTAERGDVHFVGSHPMAGSEKSGYGVARADLFERATVVVTPTEHRVDSAVDRVTTLWADAGRTRGGARSRRFTTARWPPSAICRTWWRGRWWTRCSATSRRRSTSRQRGFKDTTRIAASDPAVWREIFLANRDEVAVSLGAFREALADLERLIAVADPAALESYLARVKTLREAVR